jgi:hypothetical protein
MTSSSNEPEEAGPTGVKAGVVEPPVARQDTVKTVAQEQTDAEELRFEYDQLRKEILQNDHLTLQILWATAIINGAIMTIAFSEAVESSAMKGLLFFVVEVIAILAALQTASRSHSTFLIASYLRAFVEPKTTNLKWETRLQILRDFSPHSRSPLQICYLLILGLLALAAFGLGSWHVVQTIHNPPQLYLTFAAITVGLILTLWLLIVEAGKRYYDVSYKSKETFDHLWQDVKTKEQALSKAREESIGSMIKG